MRISDLRSDVCSSDLDFFLEKDPLFARMNLNDEEFSLYRQMYQQFQLQAPSPDLVIYLQTPVSALVERVSHRNVHYEQGIPREYLSRLAEAYSDFFLQYEAAPLLIVNNEKLNIPEIDEALTLLIEI